MATKNCKSCGHKPHSGICSQNCKMCAAAEVAYAEIDKAPLTQVERNQRYREKNREKYNAYMRRYRARVKT